ncbi:MAG TPA: methyltransferase domain-containing protein [Sediminibacterium sp.]|nr:methyltransferase domain-containing protein [Sediminibacterium sp.]
MQNKDLNEQYWNSQYLGNTTGWDMKQVSPPLKAYIDQLTRKDLRILIPGCGNSYEAEYLLNQGFTNITLIDIAPALVESLQKKFADNPSIRVLLGNFFEHKGSYDLILEQTFFCALDPALRSAYVTKMHELLKTNGILAGVLFNRAFEGGPPFGGSEAEYREIFAKSFQIRTLAPCYNSFIKREGAEVFMIFIRK